MRISADLLGTGSKACGERSSIQGSTQQHVLTMQHRGKTKLSSEKPPVPDDGKQTVASRGECEYDSYYKNHCFAL